MPRLRREEGVRIVNLSFGPRGPIGDDSISRFTYTLDRLAYDWNVLPVVAVGNDGESGGGRIQAPADASERALRRRLRRVRRPPLPGAVLVPGAGPGGGEGQAGPRRVRRL